MDVTCVRPLCPSCGRVFPTIRAFCSVAFCNRGSKRPPKRAAKFTHERPLSSRPSHALSLAQGKRAIMIDRAIVGKMREESVRSRLVWPMIAITCGCSRSVSFQWLCRIFFWVRYQAGVFPAAAAAQTLHLCHAPPLLPRPPLPTDGPTIFRSGKLKHVRARS